MHSISHPPFIKKSFFDAIFYLFATYFRIDEYAVYHNIQT